MYIHEYYLISSIPSTYLTHVKLNSHLSIHLIPRMLKLRPQRIRTMMGMLIRQIPIRQQHPRSSLCANIFPPSKSTMLNMLSPSRIQPSLPRQSDADIHLLALVVLVCVVFPVSDLQPFFLQDWVETGLWDPGVGVDLEFAAHCFGFGGVVAAVEDVCG